MLNYQIKIENFELTSPPGTGYHRAGRVTERAVRVAARVAERVVEQVEERVWRESEEDEIQ